MVAMVRERGFVTIADFARALSISDATVRRDLDALASLGLVRRVRGGAGDVGALVRPEPDVRPFADVAQSSSEAKKAIARRAVDEIRDGEVVLLDSGTTVAAMCPFLMRRALTVVTASLAVVEKLAQAPAVDVVVVGGVLRPSYRCTVGALAEMVLRQVRVDRAFLGTAGVLPDGSIMDSTPSEVPIKRAILDAARRSYLVADREKFPGGGFLKACSLADVDALVTDARGIQFDEGVGVEVLEA